MRVEILDATGAVINTVVIDAADLDFVQEQYPDRWREVPEVLPLPALPDISDRQFGEGLWRDGLIDYDAYLAFVGPGTIPAPLDEMISELPDDTSGQPTPQKIARGLITGATVFKFDNPLVDLIRAKRNWTVTELREHWAYWSSL